MKQDGILPQDFEVNQKNFNKHYDQCYQKLNHETRRGGAKKAKGGGKQPQQTLGELGDGQDLNEVSFIRHQYDREKAEYERRLKEALFGKRKKKSKLSLQERRR